MLINNNNKIIPSEKKQIFYARTYRHLQFNLRDCLIFTFVFVIPLTVLSLFFYDELAGAMSYCAAWFLHETTGITPTFRASEFIPKLGLVYYLDFLTELPGYDVILTNILVTLVLGTVLSLGRLRGKPLSVYLQITLFIHMVTCVFFLLGRDIFPYDVEDYSQLYVQQQVGIWITFLVLIGLVEGILGRGAVLYRVLIMMVILLYSFVFGTVRYGIFLWILQRYSVLYMPIMFFALGPFFDFLYFVMIYTISANFMIKRNDNKFRNDWAWG